jgi:hypothetical protein
MTQTLIVHGLKRSGNHAIVNWIRGNKNIPFYNNIAPFKKLLNENRLNAPNIQIRFILFERIIRECCKGNVNPDHRILSIEDMPVNDDLFWSDPKNARHVLVVRDPKNLFASRVKKSFNIQHPAYPREFDSIAQRAVALWKEHAREALGYTFFRSHKTIIMFERWVVDFDYRSALASKLGIDPDEDQLRRVAGQGGGSSFGDRAVTNSVLDRKALLNATEERLFNKYLEDSELIKLRDALVAQEYLANGFTDNAVDLG